jgi:hypothetical protein
VLALAGTAYAQTDILSGAANSVVDTDVVSFIFKNHSIAMEYLPDLIDRVPIGSFMTVAELDRWALEAH